MNKLATATPSSWYTDTETLLLQTAGEVQGFQGEYDNKGKYEFEGAVWRGDLITEGGGFCGARTKVCCPDPCLAPLSCFGIPLPCNLASKTSLPSPFAQKYALGRLNASPIK